MFDRAVGIAGLAVAVIGLVFSKMFPRINKRIIWGGFILGLILLGSSLGIAFLPANEKPHMVTTNNSGGGPLFNVPGQGNSIVINPPSPTLPPEPWRGWLQPADEPTPPNACGTTLPANAILGLAADSAFIATRMGRVVPFALFECTPLILERGPNGMKIETPIYDITGKLRGQVVDSGYNIPKETGLIVEHSGDLSTLVVHNDAGDELLYVRYLNPHTVRIRGIFVCPPHPLVVTVTDKEIHPVSGIHQFCTVDGFHAGIALN
jgi:hypothetical protein